MDSLLALSLPNMVYPFPKEVMWSRGTPSQILHIRPEENYPFPGGSREENLFKSLTRG